MQCTSIKQLKLIDLQLHDRLTQKPNDRIQLSVLELHSLGAAMTSRHQATVWTTQTNTHSAWEFVQPTPGSSLHSGPPSPRQRLKNLSRGAWARMLDDGCLCPDTLSKQRWVCVCLCVCPRILPLSRPLDRSRAAKRNAANFKDVWNTHRLPGQKECITLFSFSFCFLLPERREKGSSPCCISQAGTKRQTRSETRRQQ